MSENTTCPRGKAMSSITVAFNATLRVGCNINNQDGVASVHNTFVFSASVQYAFVFLKEEITCIFPCGFLHTCCILFIIYIYAIVLKEMQFEKLICLILWEVLNLKERILTFHINDFSLCSEKYSNILKFCMLIFSFITFHIPVMSSPLLLQRFCSLLDFQRNF